MTVLFTFSLDDFEIRPKKTLTQGQVRLAKIPYHKVKGIRNQKKWIELNKYFDHVGELAGKFFDVWNGKEALEEEMIISWAVRLPHKRIVDSDNIDKQIRDCLKRARVIKDDRWIRGTDITRLWQKSRGPARVCVTLKRLDDD